VRYTRGRVRAHVERDIAKRREGFLASHNEEINDYE
jgi:hypothetical protein